MRTGGTCDTTRFFNDCVKTLSYNTLATVRSSTPSAIRAICVSFMLSVKNLLSFIVKSEDIYGFLLKIDEATLKQVPETTVTPNTVTVFLFLKNLQILKCHNLYCNN